MRSAATAQSSRRNCFPIGSEGCTFLANNSMQRTALRAAADADAERYALWLTIRGND